MAPIAIPTACAIIDVRMRRSGGPPDDTCADRFGIVGPLETAVPRCERSKALGPGVCGVCARVRDCLGDHGIRPRWLG
jgi:hypothetical protein